LLHDVNSKKLHQLSELKHYKPVSDVHVDSPQIQFVEFNEYPSIMSHIVKAVVLHQLSELKQKRPVKEVQVFVPHEHVFKFSSIPKLLEHFEN